MRKSKWWQRGTCLELSEGGSDPGVDRVPSAETKILALEQASLRRVLYDSQTLSCVFG